NYDLGSGIAVDGSGHAYVTGWTDSPDYPVTAEAFQTTKGGRIDVFVTKLNTDGSGLVDSTYIGGSSSDEVYGIAVDGSGQAYVIGRTGESSDYPVTGGAFQTTKIDEDDVFVTKLNAAGSGLVYSTYLGGSRDDLGYGIAVDGSGQAYVTWGTKIPDYPVTGGTFQTTKGVGSDVFVTKLNAAGSGLVYSTYLGGSGKDLGFGIAVDGSGQAYVAGMTESTDYPVTAGAFQTTHGKGVRYVFVTKLNAAGSRLVYSTCIGEER
ncbi:MAG: SBBP repeat-containing protein, partial [Bacteroidia bacterium]|nr:SBBP repeat-containing protein [Bacteroidia bacterium]